MEETHKILWAMIAIIILFAGYLSFIYLRIRIHFNKQKDTNMIETRTYPCYLNFFLSASIAINNIFRLITFKDSDFLCKSQAFILAVFDKLIFTTITVNAYLTYRGLLDNEFYMNNIKSLFIITNIISLALALTLGIIFLCNGTVKYNVCYVKGGSFKENIDTVVSSLLFFIFLYSNLKSILFLSKNIKEIFLNNTNLTAYVWHFYRMVASLFFCSLAFLVTLLIINDSLFLDDDNIDLCFITVCLIIDLFFTLNSTVLKQTLILLGCRSEDEKDIDLYEDNEIDTDKENSQISLDYMDED